MFEVVNRGPESAWCCVEEQLAPCTQTYTCCSQLALLIMHLSLIMQVLMIMLCDVCCVLLCVSLTQQGG